MTTHHQRPLKLEFVDSWDAIFHSHLIETEVREKISRVTFEQKLAHPIGTRLRKRVAEWVDAFLDQVCTATMSSYVPSYSVCALYNRHVHRAGIN
jgi:hypothetical protein